MQLVKADVEMAAPAEHNARRPSLIPAATKFEITELVSANSGNYLHRRRSRAKVLIVLGTCLYVRACMRIYVCV